MGTRTRSRPDESRKPGKITKEGYRRLQEEASHLWSVERPKVRDAVTVAAAEGDRSENAEYIYGKRKLADIDRRLKFLGNRLDVLTVVDTVPPDDNRVHFGCWVQLESDEGDEVTYRIVGADESDIESGAISADSPVARALLGRELDDEVVVKRPKGAVNYTIVGIAVRAPKKT